MKQTQPCLCFCENSLQAVSLYVGTDWSERESVRSVNQGSEDCFCFVLFKLKLEIVIQNDVKQSHIASQPYTTDKTLVPQARSGCLIQTYSFRRCINSSETRWSGNNCKHLFTHQRWDILEYKRTGHKCNRKSLIFQKRIRLCLQTSHPADSLTTCRRLFAFVVHLFVLSIR